jgi:uncharacterized protein YndB with AHSA1/START domain
MADDAREPIDEVGTGPLTVSVSRVIAADPQEIFDVLADPSMHHVIDGSGTVRGTRSDSRKLRLGDRFTTSMRIGVPYLISNKVVELDEPRRIAWSHIAGWRWRYELEPVDGGTEVTETFDGSTARTPVGRLYLERMRWPARNRPNMEKTLARLDALVTNKNQAV